MRHRLEVLAQVRAFAAAGGSALVVSHDLGIAARSCDRLALLADGRILAAGPPREVLTPAALEAAYGIRAEVFPGPDGYPVVVPHVSGGPRPHVSGGPGPHVSGGAASVHGRGTC